jgi:uncharacterized repeat protein (TIGR01451 family)
MSGRTQWNRRASRRVQKNNPIRHAILEQLEDRRLLATLTVITTTDGGAGSLRQAILDTNAMPGQDTIVLPPGLYRLDLVGSDEDAGAFGDLDVRDPLTIRGDDAETTVIDASGLDLDGVGPEPGDRVLHVSGVAFELLNVTLQGGNVEGDGGALRSDAGSVTLLDVIVDNNAASEFGGGLATFGSAVIEATLNLDGVTIANNFAGLGGGGGVYSQSDLLNIVDSEIRDNRTQASGGGILVTSVGIGIAETLNIAASRIAGNQADGDGGGLAGFGETIRIRDSQIIDNTAAGRGGAIVSDSTSLDIVRTTLDGNTAMLAGGGIHHNDGVVNIAEATLANNRTGGNGGGILLQLGSLNLRNSTLSGNTAVGEGQGGGIYSSSYTSLNLLNNTITANRAASGGGMLVSPSGTMATLLNTIVAGNLNAQTSQADDVVGRLESISAGDLIGDGTNLSGIEDGLGGNQVGTSAMPIDPRLGPLGFHGGPTHTHLLLDGSPAIDAGITSLAPPIDQRGGQRPLPIGGDADIGAVELQTGCRKVVTTTADTFATGDGQTSLREAIVCANLTPGLDTISFNIPGAGVRTIRVGSEGLGPLPDITEAVIVDGYTQPGAAPNADPLAMNAVLLIEIDGSEAGEVANGLTIRSGGSTLGGLVIHSFRSQRIGDTTFGGNAIVLDGPGGNLVAGNLLGLRPDGVAALGNEASGILIDGSSGNTIGGTTPAERNVISGNFIGIEIEDGSTNTQVLGNLIGTDVTGTAALSTRSAGIGIYESSNNNIGGTTAASRNVIAGNGVGVYVISEELAASGNRLLGNYIGTDVSGSRDVGNDIGVLLGASSNIIGAGSTAARNVISGNQVSGVVVGNFTDALTANVSGNLVYGNFVGVTASGNSSLPNGGGNYDEIATRFNQIILEATGEPADVTGAQLAAIAGGLAVAVASGNTIGGAAAGAGNVISGNLGAGVMLAAAQDNVLQGNFIGTDLAGTANLGNAGPGVSIVLSADNLIVGNTIAFNSMSAPTTGIVMNSGSGNAIRRNSIFLNAGLGIDLAADGVTINDAGDADNGANLLLNFPVLESATIAGRILTISGFARPGVEIEFFVADPDPTGFGEGRTFLFSRSEGSADDGDSTSASYGPAPVNGLNQGTDTTNRFRFEVPLDTLPLSIAAGAILTATATDAMSNTSEFSGNVTTMADVIAPTIAIANAAAVVEGIDAVFAVTLSRPLEDGEQVLVTYNSANGTAMAPGDYIAAVAATLTFNFGDPVTKNLHIRTVDDNVPELDETFTVAITASGVSAVISPLAGGIIRDDNDLPVATINSQTVLEGSPATFTVTLNYPPIAAATLLFATADGSALAPSDYTASSGMLTFDPGDTSETISIATVDDANVEGNEQFMVNLVSATLASIGTPGSGTGTILDNDVNVDVPSITASKQDSLASDVNGDGQANPGDALGYTIRIRNDGAAAATDVQFRDMLDPNTTLVSGSVTVTPLALDDSYTVVPGTPRSEGPDSGLLSNDFDIDGATPGTHAEVQLVSASLMRVSGDFMGTLLANPNGGFTYTPPADATGMEVFQYNIVDGDGLSAVVPALVTFSVGPPSTSGKLLPASPPESRQEARSGDSGGIDLNIPLIPAGKAVEIRAQVSIQDPFPSGITRVENQAMIGGSNFASILSDDPDTSARLDPTGTPIRVSGCLTADSLSAGVNRLVYSCVTPGGFAAFVLGSRPGSFRFEKWGSTVDIADPEVFAIGVGNIDGVAVALVELTPAKLASGLLFQAFEMVPMPNVSNLLESLQFNAVQILPKQLPLAASPMDVNRDGGVSALDALAIINRLAPPSELRAAGETLSSIDETLRDHDVNRDGRVSALDALQVINSLGRAHVASSPAGEQSGQDEPSLLPAGLTSARDGASAAEFDSLDEELLQLLALASLRSRSVR